MEPLKNKMLFSDVAIIDSLLKGGRKVDKYDIFISLLLDEPGNQYDEESNMFHINDGQFKKKIYTRDELIEDIRTDTIKGKKYKFEKLNNRLENIRKYIKKQLDKSGVKFEDVIRITHDNSCAPSRRTSYYQYVDPEFDLMKIYTQGVHKDEDNSLMNIIDKRHGISETFQIENIKKAFEFQKKYTQGLRDRIIKAIKDINQDTETIQSRDESKIITTLEYALLINDPLKIAVLLRRFQRFLESEQMKESPIIEKCLSAITNQLGNTLKDLDDISKGNTRDELFGESSEIFESTIYYLRKTNNKDLPNALFSYGKYCMAIFDFNNAEKLFKECLSFYKNDEPSTVVDRIIIYNNLGNLYNEWYHLNEAEDYLKASIKLIEEWSVLMPEEPNYLLSISYNSLSSVFSKHLCHEEANEALKKARSYITNETSKESYRYNPKIEYLSLSIEHNLAFLSYERGDKSAFLFNELTVYKGQLLAKTYPTEENRLLSAVLNISYASGILKIEDYDLALSFINDALKIYDDLCEVSYIRYGIEKTYGLQRLSEVYETKGLFNKAISALEEALGICEKFDLQKNFKARLRRIEILNNLSALLLEKGEYRHAILYCEEIIMEYEILKVTDPIAISMEIVKELNNLAIAYFDNSESTVAIRKMERGLKILEDIKDHIDREVYENWKTKLETDLLKIK